MQNFEDFDFSIWLIWLKKKNLFFIFFENQQMAILICKFQQGLDNQ